MSGFSRRRLAQLGAAGLFLPRRLLAASPAAGDRKFLFIFVNGGWDPTWGFAPMYDSDSVDCNPAGEPVSVGDLRYVASDDAPSMGTFFERYADRTALVHGFEVRSVTHERCRRLVLTGKSVSDADDWPSQVAGRASGYLLPHVVVSGPSYTSSYTSSVIRLGETGQLAGLLDGTALDTTSPPMPHMADETQAAIAAYVQARAEASAAAAGRGRAARVSSDLLSARDQLAAINEIPDLSLGITLEGITPVPTLIEPALDCLERGYTRCAIASHGGQFDVGWDSHSDIDQQTENYEVLFDDLLTILEDLDGRTGSSGGPLSDEVCIVVISEMGRSPQINALGGKDHWTFTSAMFIGAGVAGGRNIGGYDDLLLGRPIDLASGEISEGGTQLSAENIGATVLALAGLDADEPIAAVLAD